MSKNVLIVGVCGGMGKATAEKLISEGYNVFGLDIKDSFDNKDVHYFKCDITNEESVIESFKLINKEISELYAVVSAAGIYKMDSLLEIKDEDFMKILDINCLGVYRVVKTYFPLLKPKSKVLLITSELAPLDPLPFNGLYTISKSLLEKYAYSLRMELNLFDIKVIIFRPGAVETPLINDSQTQLEKMCEKTIIHKNTSRRFKKIVDSVESKTIKPVKIGNKISKILKKKHPKYVYKINNNKLLKIFNRMPDRLQVFLIGKLLKKSK